MLENMVGLEGFEPPTHGLGNRCSIRLSYRPVQGFHELANASGSCVIIGARYRAQQGLAHPAVAAVSGRGRPSEINATIKVAPYS